jgi:hypothetical protein
MDNHKGQRCHYMPVVLCQEGYCKDCEIYRQQLEHPDKKTVDSIPATTSNVPVLSAFSTPGGMR